MIGVDRQRPVASHKRVVVAAQPVQRRGAIVDRAGIIRDDGQRLVVAHQGFVESIEPMQRQAAIVERLRKAWIGRECAVVVGERIGVASERMQGGSPIVERVRGIGGDRQRPFAAHDRLRVAALQVEDVAAVRPHLRRRVVAARCLVEQVQRIDETPLTTTQHAEQVERVEMIGDRLQNRGADRFDLIEAPLRVGTRRAYDRFRQ